MITKNFITFSKNIYTFPTLKYNVTSEVAQKRGGQGNLDFLKITKNLYILKMKVLIYWQIIYHKTLKRD